MMEIKPIGGQNPAHRERDPRPSWDTYFLEIAKVIATRADCTRARHGAVVVDSDKRIVSTGYNGAPKGAPGCLTDSACPRGRLTSTELGHLTGGYDDPLSAGFCISVHAEANAIIYAGHSRTTGSTIYITGEPCHGCIKLIHAAGVAKIVHGSLTGRVTIIEI
jgi:dCMP deaminase